MNGERGNFDNECVEVCCVGKGTSSCERIVIGKMAKIGRICDRKYENPLQPVELVVQFTQQDIQPAC